MKKQNYPIYAVLALLKGIPFNRANTFPITIGFPCLNSSGRILLQKITSAKSLIKISLSEFAS